MTAPGNSTLVFSLLAVLVACTGYAAGRLHQWYRTGRDRDEAYRDGYDTGTRSTFSMAARIVGPRRDKTLVRASARVHASASATDPSTSDAADESQVGAKSQRRGRHFVPDELVRAVTYRLAPDRVARAKVKRLPPSPRPAPEASPESVSPMPKQ